MIAQGMRLLLVEDEPLQREMLGSHLQGHGYVVFPVGSAEEALEELESHRIDIILTDFKLPGISGLELIDRSRLVNPEVSVVLMTAYASIDVAIKALKQGAEDFVTKPVDLDALDAILGRTVEKRRIISENDRLRRRLAQVGGERTLLGESFPFRQVLDLARRVAMTDSTVLIQGETGCGKELLSDLIQRESRRREQPYVKVNCGALPRELFESELFGHRRGAFTGAERDRAGRISEADGGTLMLDEIGELPLEAQVKLLRVLQDGSYNPVGADRAVLADIRLIACTNRDLTAMAAQGDFREDLYFRLSVVPVTIPPLRERREDIGPLLDHFVGHFVERLNTGAKELSSSARDALIKYDWPGNVRELRNVCERIVLLAREPVIDMGDLPAEVVTPIVRHDPPSLAGPVDLEAVVKDIEQTYILKALDSCKGNQTRAAELLGLSERGLRYKLRKYNISRGPHR